MAITNQADLIAALDSGELVPYFKTGIPSPGVTRWGSYTANGGNPGGGTLAGTSTTAGVVPTDATPGCLTIKDIQGGDTGYLASVQASITTVATFGGARLRLSDMLWKAGAYPFNANVSLSAQPSYSSRIPGGDYKGTEIWFETVTAFTGIPTVTIGYTNQSGTAGRSIAFTLSAAPGVQRMEQIPLQSGDTGVQKIDSVQCTIASAGTFNILVLRPLWMGFLPGGGSEIFHGPDLTDLPIIFSDSALRVDGQAQLSNNAAYAFDTTLTIIQT